MKNLKVWIKLGIGFGVVLSIMCVLSIQAIWELDRQRQRAESIADAYMPELSLAVRFERASQKTAQYMLQFISSGNQSFYDEARVQMNELTNVAQEAATLVKEFPYLHTLEENLQEAQGAYEGYNVLADKTRSLVFQLNTRQQRLQKSATDFFTILNETLDFAEKSLETLITSNSPHEEILARAKSVYMINEAIDLGSAVEIGQNRAQSLGDTEMAAKQLEMFVPLRKIFEQLNANALPQNRERVQKVMGVAEAYRVDLEAMVEEWQQLKNLSNERVDLMNKLLTNAQSTASAGIGRVQDLCALAKKVAGDSISLLIMGLALGVLIGFIFAWRLTRMITKPLEKSVDFAVDVANGNLSHKLDIDQRDEIGRLSGALNSMVENLTTRIRLADEATKEANMRKEEATSAMRDADGARQMAEQAKQQGMLDAANQLENIVHRVASASVQLAAQVEHASCGAQKQAERVGDTATSMEEMNISVLDVARNTSVTAEVSNQARRKAAVGADAVNKVVSGMDRINSGAIELRRDMEQLSTRAESIGSILNVISDIADQTNLLALNAAIEAARAGEAGRGFAVVADEVRKLAEKTMQATSEVGTAIRGIQEGTTMNMAKVENTVEIVTEVTDLATSSGQALTEIVSLVDQASEQIRAIAAASEEQSATSESISRAVTEVNQIASETAITMQESGRAVGELNEQTKVLNQLISNMKKG